ncbi:MAG: glycosyltransferase family 2 protein [Magnetospirillum sp.]|nr:glycosyltransferase family 2 protein [Magnetospirillum sp.]
MPDGQNIKPGLSYVVPAYNEENGIVATLERLKAALATLDVPYEIILVDDGSRDATRQRAKSVDGITVVGHPINTGYGSAIKTGILCAQYEWIGIVDADGTYPIERVGELVDKMKQGFDVAVAARENVLDTDKPFKRMARQMLLGFINTWVSGKIVDPNSGFRIFSREFAMTFFPFLCDTFSFTTSSTIFAIGEGYFVCYVPMEYTKRVGKSKVRHVRDSMRMAQLILQGITFFNPVKFFLMLVLGMVACVDLPALALAEMGAKTFAFYYALGGTMSVLLFGLGVLGDITRVATTTRINKKHSIVREARGG